MLKVKKCSHYLLEADAISFFCNKLMKNQWRDSYKSMKIDENS